MIIDRIAMIILIIGGLNWGSVGLFNADLVAMLFGEGSVLARIVYCLVAVSAIWCVSLLFRERSAVTDGEQHGRA